MILLINCYLYDLKSLQDMLEQELTKAQLELIGKGYAGPPVALNSQPLTYEQANLPIIGPLANWSTIRLSAKLMRRMVT